MPVITQQEFCRGCRAFYETNGRFEPTVPNAACCSNGGYKAVS